MTFSLSRVFAALAGSLLLMALCAMPADARPQKPFRQTGTASWYGAWHHGRTTASGEAFDMFAMTAAHKSLPLGTLVKVTRKDSGKSLVVRINDRGPYKKRRIIDLSYAAACSLDIKRKGVTRVSIEVVSDREGRLLSGRHELFVRLKDGRPTRQAVEHQLGRLIHLGMREAPALLHTRKNTMAIGPFRSFEEAQGALVRVATTHPEANIMLAEKGSMKPALEGLEQK